MWDFLKSSTSDEARKELESQLEELCEKSSSCELRAIKCERDVNNMKFAEYMAKHIGEQYEATVTTIANYGCYCQLDNTIEGIINFKNLSDDFWSYDNTSNELRAKNSGKRIWFGKRIKVQVVNADKYTRKIEFKYIDDVKQ